MSIMVTVSSGGHADVSGGILERGKKNKCPDIGILATI